MTVMWKEKEITIEEKELQILLNRFDHVSVSYPIERGFELFSARAGKDGYRLSIMEPDLDSLDDGDLPSFNDVKECALASGIISYDNADEFYQRVKVARMSRKKVHFAPDTNVLYHRFMSVALPDDRIPLAPTVKAEVIDAMNKKHSSKEITTLLGKVNVDETIMRMLSNRRKLRSRKAAYLAMQEMKEIDFITVSPVDPRGSIDNDHRIINELKEFQHETGSNVVIVTADRSMVDMCDAENMDYVMLHYPSKIDAKRCTARQLTRFLFNLAAVFGFIKVNSTILFGEFPGKNELDEVRVRLLNEQMIDGFKASLETCRQLMELKQELAASGDDF